MTFYHFTSTARPTPGHIRTLKSLYFSDYPEGRQEDLAHRLEKAGFDLFELEFFARRLRHRLGMIEDWLGKKTDRDNLLCYAVEIFGKMDWEGVGLDPERKQLIKTIRSLEGFHPETTKIKTKMNANTENNKELHPEYLDDLDLQVLEEDMEREFDQLMKRLAEMERQDDKKGNLQALQTEKSAVN